MLLQLSCDAQCLVPTAFIPTYETVGDAFMSTPFLVVSGLAVAGWFFCIAYILWSRKKNLHLKYSRVEESLRVGAIVFFYTPLALFLIGYYMWLLL